MKMIAPAQAVLLLVVTLSVTLGAPVHPTKECRAGLRVHLTVNSNVINSTLNQVELNWAGAAPKDGDWVGLFSSDPSVAGTGSPLEKLDLNASSMPEGFFVTETMAKNYATNSSELGFSSRCLDYHIGYVSSGGQVLASSCMRLEPTWMADLPGLGDQIIKDIFIPGSHDTGSYANYEPILGDTLVIKYTVTQDEDLLAQLIRGVRYLDIRVGYYGKFMDLFSHSILCKYPGCRAQRAENASGFWINHGAFQMHRLEVVVEQVKEFLRNTEKEVLIFDVQEFPYGFATENIHHLLISYLYQEFSSYIIPRGLNEWNSKLSDLWSAGRIIISYDNSNMVGAYPWIWKRVEHKWGDVRTPSDLFTYLTSINNNPPASAWSAMAELTPTAWDVITDELGGLRKMADSVNRNVTTWYQGSWGQTANVVAVDFVRGSDIINTAIEWNKMKIGSGGRAVKCANKWERNQLNSNILTTVGPVEANKLFLNSSRVLVVEFAELSCNMSRGGFYRGRGRQNRNFGDGGFRRGWNEDPDGEGSSASKYERRDRGGGGPRRGRGGHPAGLKGRDIGMFYKKMSEKKKDDDMKKKLSVRLDPSRRENISRMLASIPSSASSSSGKADDFKFDNIEESDFKRRFLKNLEGNLRSNSQLQSSVFDQMVQDVELDEELKKDMATKKNNVFYLRMQAERAKLPAADKSEEVIDAVRQNQVIVISGETGCGKTTQVPQFLLDDAISKGEGSMCRIICTQPRRISAITIAQRVAEERNEKLGKSVGYQIRLECALPRSKGCILYCTTGILLQFLQSDPNLKHTSHIIIDEIHEQDILSDFVLTIVRDLLPRRPDLKIILMSATLNAQSFSKYYHQCPMIHIPGFTHPVTVYHLEDVLKFTNFKVEGKGRSKPIWTKHTKDGREKQRANSEYDELMGPFLRHLKSKGTFPDHVINSLSLPDSEELNVELITALVQHICQSEPEGAILVFLPGWDQISKLYRMITESSFFSSSMFRVLPLHSQMPTVNQKEIFVRPPSGVRKIIIATNIAETSITINDVVYVVDCGKIKLKNYNVQDNIQTLQPEWVSFANAKQRRGRAGRVRPGVCYHLFSERREMALADYPVPEMLRSRLEEVVLQVKILQLGLVKPFLGKVMQPPNPMAIDNSLELLRVLNALDDEENLTPLGFHLAQLPMDPQLGKMILMAALFRCLDPVLSIAASLSFKDPFNLPLGSEKKVDRIKFDLSRGQKSDHIVLCEAVKLWEKADAKGQGGNFCWNHFLSSNTLSMLKKMKGQLAEHLHKMKFVRSADPKDPEYNVHSENFALIKAVVSAGLYPNIAILKKVTRDKKLMKTATDWKAALHPKSVNNFPTEFESPLFTYHLKMKSATVYLHDTTMVYPMPLLFFGSRLRLTPDQNSDASVLKMDQFEFRCNEETSTLLLEMRRRLDALLEHKITHPHTVDWQTDSSEKALVQAIVELITTEDKTNLMGTDESYGDDSD